MHPADRVRVGEILRRVRRDRRLRARRRDAARRADRGPPPRRAGRSSPARARTASSASATTAPEPPTESRATAAERLERRNEELAARMDELEERYDAVERFAGTAAHQLAEPLVIAESSAILVADELGADLDPMLRDRLDAIGRGAARAPSADGRAAGRRADGGRPLELRRGRRRPTSSTRRSRASSVRSRKRGATIAGRAAAACPRRGRAALDRVREPASPTRSSTVRAAAAVSVIASEPLPGGWRVSVASEGMPIPPEEATRIFEPFHRVPGERRVPGVGLGLTICARLVERLGGTIGVEPGAESGNTFWVDLPAAAQAAASGARRLRARAVRMRSAATTASSRERTSSLRRMFLTCERTVSIESTSSSAIRLGRLGRLEQVDDLPLARGQRALDGAHARDPLGVSRSAVDQHPRHPARDRGLALPDALERARERVDVEVLGEVAARAGAERLETELVVLVVRRPSSTIDELVGELLADLARRDDAVQLGHHDVHHHDVRPVVERRARPPGGRCGPQRSRARRPSGGRP